MSKEAISELMSQLKAKKLTFTGELEPEKTTNLAHTMEVAKKLKEYVVACNVTDNPQPSRT
jgi:5,10-methylenetetrahydrofolate reductase